MATITKTLRTSGGDFANLAAIATWIGANMVAGVGPHAGDDLIVDVDGDVTFTDAAGGLYCMEDDTVGAISGSCTLRTKPSDSLLGKIAVIKSVVEPTQCIFFSAFSNAFSLALINLKLAEVNAGMIGCNNAIVTMQNCYIVLETTMNALNFNCQTSGQKVSAVIENNTFAISMDNPYVDTFISGGRVSQIIFANNIIVAKPSGNLISVYCCPSGPTDLIILRNNIYYNYAGIFSFSKRGGGTVTDTQSSGNLNIDPQTKNQLVQNTGDSLNIMLGRDFRQVSGSPAIDGADPTYATATDIFGTVRT